MVHIFNIDSFEEPLLHSPGFMWQMQLCMEGLNKAPKICQQSCTIYRKLRFIRTKSALFMRSLLHLQKEHSNSRVPICSKAALQTRQKSVLNLVISFKNTWRTFLLSPVLTPLLLLHHPQLICPPQLLPILAG